MEDPALSSVCGESEADSWCPAWSGPSHADGLPRLCREDGSSTELSGLCPGGGVERISLHPCAAEVTEVSSALRVGLGYGGHSYLSSCNAGSLGGCGYTGLSLTLIEIGPKLFLSSPEVFLIIETVAQWYPTHRNPMDCSQPGFSFCGIFQARILECVAIPFSRGSS